MRHLMAGFETTDLGISLRFLNIMSKSFSLAVAHNNQIVLLFKNFFLMHI